jgi:hypothetical protein
MIGATVIGTGGGSGRLLLPWIVGVDLNKGRVLGKPALIVSGRNSCR